VILVGLRLFRVRLAVMILLLTAMMVLAGCAYDPNSAESTAGGYIDPISTVAEETDAGESTEAFEENPPEADESAGDFAVQPKAKSNPPVIIDFRKTVTYEDHEHVPATSNNQIFEIKDTPKLQIDEIGLSQEKPLPDPLSGILDTELEVEQRDDQARIRITLRNISDGDLKLVHGSGQRYDIWVYDAQGNVVYQWSQHYAFVQMVIDWELGAGESVSFEEEWDYTNNARDRLPPGKYVVKAVVLAGLQSGEAIDASQLMAEAEIEIRQPELSDD